MRNCSRKFEADDFTEIKRERVPERCMTYAVSARLDHQRARRKCVPNGCGERHRRGRPPAGRRDVARVTSNRAKRGPTVSRSVKIRVIRGLKMGIRENPCDPWLERQDPWQSVRSVA